MRTSRWVLAILVTASTVLAAVSVGVRRGEGGGFPPPSSGSLLPFDSTLLGPPRNLATLIDTGLDVVEDVATIGDTVLMLSRSSWRVVTGTRTRGPFGAEPPGSPQGIGRANRIIAADSTVYILGTERREVSRWTRTGRLIERLAVAAPAQLRLPQDMAVIDGRVFVVAQELDRGSMQWIVLELRRDGEPVELLRAPPGASFFTQPRIAAAGNDVLLIDPVSHETRELFSGRVRARIDAPVWPTTDSVRREYEASVGRIAAGRARAPELPDVMPSLQRAAVTRSGIILTGTNPLGDALHVEAFARDGAPVGRLTNVPLEPPLFLTADGIVRVSEEPRSIIFTLLPLTGS